MKKLLSPLLAACLSLSLAVPAAALDVEDAKDLLETYYVHGVPAEVMEMDSLDEILAALGDPYTTYLTAEEYQKLLASINGSTVVGIGATIATAFDNGYQILSVLPDSPSLDAGLKAGDVILAVDGVTLTADIEPTALIRGDENTTVTLTIRRQGGQVRDFSLTRRKVTIPIVEYEIVGDAGVIQCDSFGASTVETVAKAIQEMEPEAAAYIMDLRSNPGGTSQAAAGSSGLFIGPGIMSYFRDGDGKYNYVFTRPNCPDLTDKPLMVLTSPYSASGSELFAAAVRDHGVGISIGQRTFGKGVAQYMFDNSNFPDLFDGDCLKITVYRFFSPDGATNDTIGVIPTLTVSPEHTTAAALLLSAPQPAQAQGHMRLQLAGQTLYLDLKEAAKAENTAAMTELLEALPPSAVLHLGAGGGWASATPQSVARELGLTLSPRTFSDVAGSRFEQEINTLACSKLISGYEDGSFRPDESITRAEFCTMVAGALNLRPTSNAPAFSDVAVDSWYADAVSAMTGKGFLSGYGDGTFHPDAIITYEEMVTVLASAAAWADMDAYDYAKMELAGQAVETYSQFSAWAQRPARDLDLLGALVGDLAPKAPVDRQTAAGMLCALMEGTHLLWS